MHESRKEKRNARVIVKLNKNIVSFSDQKSRASFRHKKIDVGGVQSRSNRAKRFTRNHFSAV